MYAYFHSRSNTKCSENDYLFHENKAGGCFKYFSVILGSLLISSN